MSDACPERGARIKTRRMGRGFTLLETMLTLIIVSIGVAGVFDAYTSFVTTNTWSTHSATGTFVASEIRELTRRLPKHDPVNGLELVGESLVGWGPDAGEFGPRDFDDLDDFDGLVFAFDGALFNAEESWVAGLRLPGPIDATGFVLEDFALLGVDINGEETPFGWAQEVTVEKVNPFDFSQVLEDNATEPPSSGFRGRGVDEFPLRVTVRVTYRDPMRDAEQEVAWVSWVVP